MASREETAEMVKIMQAYADGQDIEHSSMRNPIDAGWLPCDPEWDFRVFRYRIKPKPREWWSVPYHSAFMCASRGRAEELAKTYPKADGTFSEVVHVREVLE